MGRRLLGDVLHCLQSTASLGRKERVGETQRTGIPHMKAAAGEGEEHLGKSFHIQRAVYSSILMAGLKKGGLEDLKEISVVMW